ncbi:MAG: LD-carboxypeptidase, partial [Firmicutes bacterium]|nr:LD-carboxypeptidase [Bacillota bacterium]
MIKTVGIVSLSRGTIGEDFVKHEVDLGIRRLKDFGLEVRFMPHALKGIEYVAAHPEKRAADLLEALRDPSIDMILCAIGGDDTYRLLPHLLGSGELAEAVGAAG